MKNITKNNSMLHRMIALVMAVVMTLTLVAIDSHFHLFADEAEVAANDVDTIDVTNVLNGYSDGHEATVAYATNKSKVKLSVNKADIADIKLTAKVGDEDITVEGKDIDVKDIKYLTYKENATDDKDKLNKNPATPTDADKTTALSENVALSTEDNDSITYVALYYAYKKDNAVVKYIYMGTAKVLYDVDAPSASIQKINLNDNAKNPDGTDYILVNDDGAVNVKLTTSDGKSGSGIDRIVYIKDGGEEIELENDEFNFVAEKGDTSGSGTYVFKAYDKAGNVSEASAAVIIKRVVNGPSIKSVTPELVKKNGVDFRLPTFNQTNSGYEFTVEVNDAKAGEGSGAVSIESDVCYYIAGDSTHTQVVNKDKAGKYVFYVSDELLKKDDDGHPARIVIYAKDNVFGNRSVGEDQNGDIVFTGGSKPVITVSAGDPDWTKNWVNGEHSFDVKASSNSAYIDSVSYSVDGVSKNVVAGGTAFEYEKSVVVDGVAGDDAASNESNIYLPDGEHDITFTAKDYAGGEESAKTTVKIDNTAPVVSIKDYKGEGNFNTATEASQACFNISYSDATSGIYSVTAILRKKVITTDPETGDTIETFSDIEKYSTDATDDNYKLTVDGANKEIQIPGLDKPDDASGTYSLTLVATDIAGNTCKEVTRELYVNFSKLKVGKFVLNVDDEVEDLTSVGEMIWTSGNALSIDAAVESFELDKKDVKLVVERTALNDTKATAILKEYFADTVDDGNVSVKYALPSEGKYTIKLMAKVHGTGDFHELGSADIVYDKTAPGKLSILCKSAFSSYKGVAYYASKEDVCIDIKATETNLFNKILSYSIIDIDKKGKEINGGEIEMPSKSGEYVKLIDGSKESLNIKANTLYEVKLTVKDKAGNIATSTNVASFVVDTKLPEINTNESSISKYNKNSVTLNWTGSIDPKGKNEVNSGLYQYRLKYDCTVYTSSNGIIKKDEEKSFSVKSDTWQSYDEKKAYAKFTQEGVYSNVTLEIRDRANNVTTKNIKDFIIDKGAPEIIVNNDFKYNYDHDPDNKNKENTYYIQEKGEDVFKINGEESEYNPISFDVVDAYGIGTEYTTVTIYSRTYDVKEYKTATYKFNKVNGKRLRFQYNILPSNRKATEYYFVIETTDSAGRTNKHTTGKYYIVNKAPIVEITEEQYNKFIGREFFNYDIELEATVQGYFKAVENTFTVLKNGQIDIGPIDCKVSGDGQKWKTKKKITYKQEGVYNIELKATDQLKNESSDTVHFVIDKTAPEINAGQVQSVNNGSVQFNVKLHDEYKGSKYDVHVIRKDSAGNVVEKYTESKEWGNNSKDTEYTKTFDAEGDYSITVSAEDEAGNKSETTKATTFRIDKTAPVISITGMNDKQTTGVTATISIDEAFSLKYEDNNALGSSDFNVTITRKTDGTAATNVATLGTDIFSEGNPHTVSYNCSEDGEYTITAIATDLAGNKAAEQTKTFKVDSKAPVLKVNAVDKDSKKVEDYAPIGSIDSSTPNYVDMSLSVEEAFFATDNVEISVKKDSKDVSSSYFTNYRNSAEISTGTQRFSEDGVYEVSIKAQDELGNKADDYKLVFTVDNTPPELAATNVLDKFKAKTTKTDDGSILLNADDFADIINQGYEALWNVNDTSDFSVDAKIDGVSLIDFSDLSDGYHQLTIKVTDKVGHVAEDEFDFTYDGTAPRIIITGVEDGETVREPFTMTIGLENPDDEITSIVINGNTIDPANYSANNKYEMQVQDYDTYTIEVTAKDKAGNVASTIDEDTGAVFTFKLSEKLSPVVLVIIIIAAILLIALLIFIILASKRKKKNAAA